MTHRVLVVGVGSIGERHLRCFLATGRAQCGFVEVNAGLSARIGEKYGVKERFASLDAALGTRPSFDIAVICTPSQLHVPMATQLVDARIHVLIEKPLSTAMDGVAELKALVAAKGVVAAVAYVWRASPILGAMREAVLSGRFGRPVEVVVVTGQHFPTARPAYRDIYYKDRATGGGAIQDALTHMINAVEWLVGPVVSLAADAAHQLLDGVRVEDTVHLLARHAWNKAGDGIAGPLAFTKTGNGIAGAGSQVLASYALNQYQAPTEVGITVICERGTARFEPMEHRWRWMIEPNSTWHDEVFPAAERDAMYLAQANGFLDAVEAKGPGGPVACTLEEAEQTLRVNLAALASAEAGALRGLA